MQITQVERAIVLVRMRRSIDTAPGAPPTMCVRMRAANYNVKPSIEGAGENLDFQEVPSSVFVTTRPESRFGNQ